MFLIPCDDVYTNLKKIAKFFSQKLLTLINFVKLGAAKNEQ